MAKVLLINPSAHGEVLQNHGHSLSVLKVRFVAPPLPLLTVAAIIPQEHALRVIDLNVSPLTDEDMGWADIAFITGIELHRQAIKALTARCRQHGVFVIVGGLCATRRHEDLDYADCFVLGESEDLLPVLFDDLRDGNTKRVYRSAAHPDLVRSPCPRFDLVDMRDYMMAILQWSRGCPHSCSFCQIAGFYGKRYRHKTAPQFLRELDALYATGFRGSVMLGDDNFLAHPSVEECLTATTRWQRAHGFPFAFLVQTDISAASKDTLVTLMEEAGFVAVQIGIESPSLDALRSVNKTVNTQYDMVASVKALHRKGIEVLPALLVGLDGDPDNIFELQYRFIQTAGTPQPMISLLDVAPGTALHERLDREGRITGDFKGLNTGSYRLNYVPRMDPQRLLEGYLALVHRAYRPEAFFDRCETFLRDFRIHHRQSSRSNFRGLFWLLRFLLETIGCEYGRHFRRFLVKTLRTHPTKITMAAELGMRGYHFHRMSEEEVAANRHLDLRRATWSDC